MVKLFYDLETTGTEFHLHSIHQIAGIIEVDDQVVETFDIKTRPHPKARIEQAALTVGRVTLEEIMNYQPMEVAYRKFKAMLDKYINKFEKGDRIFLIGYNNMYFDDTFLRLWFEQNNDPYFNGYFWKASIDVSALAAEYLLARRRSMPSFKLSRVCKEVGIVVDDTKTHNGVYDCELLRELYRIVTKREIEL